MTTMNEIAEERFITPGPLPTDREREMLIILIEECAEVQHRAAKALRFGLGETEPGQVFTNKERLEEELGDLDAVFRHAVSEDILNEARILNLSDIKESKLARFRCEGQEG